MTRRRTKREQEAFDEALRQAKEESGELETEEQIRIRLELEILEQRTRNNPTDADRDIDFAYRNMANPNVTPSIAPSTSAWSWYLYSRTEPNKFLEICAKREDAKAKAAGTITSQRMEDDKRQQFAILDRLERQLTLDVRATVRELMEKFPEDVLFECRKFAPQWKAFLEKYPP